MPQKLFDFHGSLDKVVLRQYLVVINPPQKIDEGIQSFKRDYLQKFGAAFRRGHRPHLTVSSFVLDQKLEAALEMEFTAVCSAINPFMLTITGFNGFPSNGLVFLDLEESRRFNNLQNELLMIVRKRLGVPPKHSRKTGSKPHITIALSKNLREFKRVMTYFTAKDYRREFEVSHLTVASRYYPSEEDREQLGPHQAYEKWKRSKWTTDFKIKLHR